MISRSAETNVGWMSSALVHMRELRLIERHNSDEASEPL